MKEKKEIYVIEPLFEHFNENHQLKPFGYQHIMNVLANDHLKNTNQPVGALLQGRYVWVLVSMTFEVVKEIKDIKEFYGKTWYAGRKGPYYRREYFIGDENGETYLKGASYSVLLDMTDRSVYRQKELPFKAFMETQEYLVDCEPRFKQDVELKTVTEERSVLNSFIDPVGHVNNLRYTEFIYDAWTNYEVENINKIKRFELYFENELRKNDKFEVRKGEEGGKVVYTIYNNTLDKKAFSLVYTLTKE